MVSILSWRTKAGYAAVDLGLSSVELLLQIYLLKFYHVTVGLPAFYTGMALAIAIFWDAVSDPLMGSLSDSTRHSAGRRRPYILPGALALALCFVLIFNPPDVESTAFKFAFLLVSYVLLNTAMTVVSVPHAALGGELSFDRHERTEIFGYKRLFDTLGALLGLLLPAIILGFVRQADADGAIEYARNLVGLLLSLPIVLTAWITVRATRGLDRVPPVSQPLRMRAILSAQLSTLKNPYFRFLLAAFAVIALGRVINASTALYYYEYRLGFSETETVLFILLPFFIAFLASIPLWVLISRRKGKKWPAVIGVIMLGLSTAIVYPLFPPGQIFWPLLYAIPGGLFVGAVILLDSLVADVIDYDELKIGYNREGLYFGMWKMATKVARAGGLIVAGFLFDLIGFEETAAMQSEVVSWRLSLIFGPVVGLLFFLGGLAIIAFPLTEARHRRIQRLLVKRRAKQRLSA